MLNTMNYICKIKEISTISSNVVKTIVYHYSRSSNNNYLIKRERNTLKYLSVKLRFAIQQLALFWNSTKWSLIQRALIIKLLKIPFDIKVLSI
jgi:hypothetical protein